MFLGGLSVCVCVWNVVYMIAGVLVDTTSVNTVSQHWCIPGQE